MDALQLAKTVLGATHLQAFINAINKKRKEYLLGPDKPQDLLTQPHNPYQELRFEWQQRAKRFVVYQGLFLWGYIDKDGYLYYPANSPNAKEHIRGNLKDEYKGLLYINSDGTIMNKRQMTRK